MPITTIKFVGCVSVFIQVIGMNFTTSMCDYALASVTSMRDALLRVTVVVTQPSHDSMGMRYPLILSLTSGTVQQVFEWGG